MSPAGARFALLPLLLLPLVGCAELQRVDVSDLRPGTYCEIEMVVPPNAAEDSHHKYMGWVKETIGKERKINGVIVAKEIGTNLRYAVSVMPNVTPFEYEIEFHLRRSPSDR